MDIERATRVIGEHLSTLMSSSEWQIEEANGHLWLRAPATLPASFRPAYEMSLLLGSQRRATVDEERQEAYLGALGRYLVDVADRLAEFRAWADPQRVLDDQELHNEQQIYEALHRRTATGPAADELEPIDALLGLLSSPASPAGVEVDWEQFDIDFPDDYRRLIETWGPLTFGGLQIYAPEDIRRKAEKFAERTPADVVTCWPEPGGFLPAGNHRGCEVGWHVDRGVEPNDWDTGAVGLYPKRYHSTVGGLAHMMLAQMTGVDANPELRRNLPRVVPGTSWHEVDWPDDWSSEATFAWYKRAFEGGEDEISGAAAFIGENAPEAFIDRLLEGVELGEPTRLPVLFRQGNGFLGVNMYGHPNRDPDAAAARAVSPYVNATLEMVGHAAGRFDAWRERTEKLRRLEIFGFGRGSRHEGEWFPNLEEITLHQNLAPSYTRKSSCTAHTVRLLGSRSSTIDIHHHVEDLTIADAPSLKRLKLKSTKLRRLVIRNAPRIETIELADKLDLDEVDFVIGSIENLDRETCRLLGFLTVEDEEP